MQSIILKEEQITTDQQQEEEWEEEKWIEADGEGNNQSDDNKNNEQVPNIGDLFADPDPYDTFCFAFGKNITITLSGVKAKNGQTIRSKGLMVWRASLQLCHYMVEHAHLIWDKHVVEVSQPVAFFASTM